jgi:allantoate deiminase
MTMGANSYGHALMADLDLLATDSDDPAALTRLYLGPAHGKARERVARWMEQAGMRVRADALGTVIGRLEGLRPGLPALMLGSHIDTVRDGGKYDGALGVLAAIAAVNALRRREPLPFALEIVAFGDEENVRFPSTLLSSRAVAGLVDDAELDARDSDGVSIREALVAAGDDPAALASCARKAGDILAYLELHIEQGPVLEGEGLALAAVSAINGRIRFDVTVTGEAGHAGTVPFSFRRDALVGAAEMVTMVREIGSSHDGIFATVGEFVVAPGASNVIPGKVTFTIDLRSADDAARDSVANAITAGLSRIAEAHDLALALAMPYRQPATPMHGGLRAHLVASIEAIGQPPRILPSGAGHDAMAMAKLCPSGMIFLRCKGGISHNPAESITEADADLAVRVLIEAIERFSPTALNSG